MFKKLFAILSCLIITLSLPLAPAFAATKAREANGLTFINQAKSPITDIVQSQIYCENSPDKKHHMFAKGIGVLLDSNGNVVYNDGYAYQCEYCTTVVVTEYNAVNYKLGRYAIADPGYEVSDNGTALKANHIYTNNSNNQLTGFYFYYS